MGEGVAINVREKLSLIVLERELDSSLEDDPEPDSEGNSESVVDGVAITVIVFVWLRVDEGDNRNEKVLCLSHTHPVPMPSFPLFH